MMEVAAVVQARMGSTRLPGKVMMKVGRKPLLGVLLARLERSRALDGTIVATTLLSGDDVIVSYCEENGYDVFRGDEVDVLQRYIGACNRFNVENAVRVTGDNPLTDIDSMDDLISQHLLHEADYSHCRGFPLGTATEVTRSELLRSIYLPDLAKQYREHVTLYFHDRPEGYRIFTLENRIADAPSFRLTVDTVKDLELMRCLATEMGKLELLDTKDVLQFLRGRPDLRSINSQVVQKDPRK